MIKEVWIDRARWNDLPWRFEPGTPPIARGRRAHGGASSTSRSSAWSGWPSTSARWRRATVEQLAAIPGVTRLRAASRRCDRGAVVAFSVEGLHPHDVAALLDAAGHRRARRAITARSPCMRCCGVVGTRARQLLGLQLARGGRAPARTRLWPALADRGSSARRPCRTGPRDPFVSPRFGQIATFMLLPAADVAGRASTSRLLGLPYDGGVSYRPGARFGPRAVREQSSLIRPWNPVLKVHPVRAPARGRLRRRRTWCRSPSSERTPPSSAKIDDGRSRPGAGRCAWAAITR